MANAIGISKQGFTNKMTRDSFTDKDMYMIANYLGMEVIIKGEKEYVLKEDWNISSFFVSYHKYTKCVQNIQVKSKYFVYYVNLQKYTYSVQYN